MDQNVNHVDHVIWACWLEELSGYVDRLSAVTGVAFDGPWDKVNLGIRVYISWEAGLEIIAPLEPSEIAFAQKLAEHLRARGSGIYAIVFGVRDISLARRRALDLGYEPSAVIEQLGDEPWFDKTVTMKEVLVGDFMQSLLIFGEITYPPGVIEKP